MSERIHIAGTRVQVGALMRQRCAWCGVVLIDYDPRLANAVIGQDVQPPMWVPGTLISTAEHATPWVVGQAELVILPPGSCALDGDA